MTFGPDLTLALELADIADGISMARFRATDLVVETKPDLTPVSEADHAVEVALRRKLGVARPGQAILGEEGGQDACSSGASARWIVDPIDGTKNYVRGVPVWATLIALAAGRADGGGRGVGAGVGPAVVGGPGRGGVRRRPAHPRVEGGGGGGRLHLLRRPGALRRVPVAVSLTDGRLLRLAQRCWRSRGLGDFWSHVLVAEGAVDIAAEPEVSLWDVAPIQVIVEEAGGRFTNLAGEARADGGSAVSTNGLLHDEVLAALT